MFALQTQPKLKNDADYCNEMGIHYKDGKFVVSNINYKNLEKFLKDLKNSSPQDFNKIMHFLADFCNSSNYEIKQKGLTKTDVNAWIASIMKKLGKEEEFNDIRNRGKTNADWSLNANGSFRSPPISLDLASQIENKENVEKNNSIGLDNIIPNRAEKTEKKTEEKQIQPPANYTLSLENLEEFKSQAKKILLSLATGRFKNQQFQFSLGSFNNFLSDALRQLDLDAIHYFFLLYNNKIISLPSTAPTKEFFENINKTLENLFQTTNNPSKIYSSIFLIFYYSFNLKKEPFFSLINHINLSNNQDFITNVKNFLLNKEELDQNIKISLYEHLGEYLDLDKIFRSKK
ncbi:MAG: hypothetical protein QXH71_01020 [Candidatus Anstonellaceae archaeon]